MIEESQPFPEFTLQDQDGRVVTRENLLGSKSVVYFYPKDDTSGCTTESCGFRDSLPRFRGAKVFGVSPDDVRSHRRFADKYNLTFTLLADTEHELSSACDVWIEKSMYGRTYMGIARTTYLLDENGIVRKVFRNVKPAGHELEVLEELEKI